MTKPISFGKVDVELASSMAGSVAQPQDDTPFRILLMGDLTGRCGRGDRSQGPAQWRLHRIDRDNLDEVMARLNVELALPLRGLDAPPVTVRFAELDDFHPDRLYERLEIFRELRERRSKPAVARPSPASREPVSGEELASAALRQTPGNLLDQILDNTGGEVRETAAAPRTEWDRYLSELVRPHLVPDDDREAVDRNRSLDEIAGELMRAILHYPDFQNLEALWRGIAFLTSRLETGEELQLFLLDVTKEEVAADLCGSEIRGSGLSSLLVENSVNTPGAPPWALLAGLYTFANSREDVALLARLSQVAAAAGAPFIGGASETIVGCDSLAANPDPDQWRSGTDAEALTWLALRRLSTSPYIGLVLPRFLLRLPYGAAAEPLDSFDFEEALLPPQHEEYLWGNPALAAVSLLGQTFSEVGWGMKPGAIQDIKDLPLHVFRWEGEARATPCAEALLTYEAAELLMAWGLMPLVSFKDRDMARLARFQSVADPPAGLAGRWE